MAMNYDQAIGALTDQQIWMEAGYAVGGYTLPWAADELTGDTVPPEAFGLGIALIASLTIGQTALMLVGAAIVRAVYYAHTGRWAEIAGKKIYMPTRYLRQIRKEPHYLDGGVVFRVVAAASVELVTVGHVVAPVLA